jgi:GT2 family glycosyltransferase
LYLQCEHDPDQPQLVPGLVSIVVVNWNGMNYLPECLDSVLAQDYARKEIVVVDNGSTDGSRAWLRERASCWTRLIEFDSNTGFAGGVNAGIRASNGEFVALLNNDAVAESGWLSELMAAAADPAVGMVASKILFYNRRNIIDKTGHLFYPDGLNRGRGAGEVDAGQFDSQKEIFFPDGCAALYRYRMLQATGLFDEDFFAYGDDADLGLRARWQGWRCTYAANARVYHRHSSSLGKYSPEKAFLVERNRFWVAVKLLPWPLLVVSPFFTFWRFCWHISSLFSDKGLAGGVARDHNAARLAWALVRAYLSGFAGLTMILRKRRDVFQKRKISSAGFMRLIRKYRISARELALRD